MNEITKGQKDQKDKQKMMAIHYFCKFGVDQSLSLQQQKQSVEEIMNLFLESKAKFSQFAGHNKYTPLIYASTYNNYEIVE